MATDEQIIEKVRHLGHFDRPFGQWSGDAIWRSSMTVRDEPVKAAIRSYQDFMSVSAEPLIARHHPQRNSSAIIADGDIGPATRDLFDLPRCGMADYALPEAATGQGNWRNCHGITDGHCVTIKFINSPPAFLAPHFEEVKKQVQEMYADIGLLIKWVSGNEFANIHTSFVTPTGSWIGLAIVGRGLRCDSSGRDVWIQLDKGFQPSRVVGSWVSLLAHEIGHTTGSGHNRSGIMAPSLQRGLPPTWRGDAAEGYMVGQFGGVPIPIPGDEPAERKMVVGYEYPDGRFTKLYDLPTGGDIWPGE